MADVEIDKVGSMIDRVVTSVGLELVHWEIKGVGSAKAFLRITIDRAEGITHENCVAVDRALSAELETDDLIPFAYTLEITSPGLGKGLSGQPDFDRNRGAIARIRAKEPVDERLNFKGRVAHVTPKEVTLAELDGREYTIQYTNIFAANLVQLPKGARRGESPVETPDE